MALTKLFSEDAAKLRQWRAFLSKNRIEAAGLGDTVALLDDLLWPPTQVAAAGSRGWLLGARKPCAGSEAVALPNIDCCMLCTHLTAAYVMSQSEEQLASLNLLREALNYLERLPAHPMTYAMALKIRNHLSNPQTLAQERRLHEVEAAEKFSRHGQSGNFGFTDEGLPTLSASLVGGVLTLKSPAAAEIPEDELEGFSRRLTSLLAEGVEVRLAPVQEKSHRDDTK